MKLRPNGLPDRIGARVARKSESIDFAPGVCALADAEHEADGPILDDDAPVVVHEDRQIGVWGVTPVFRRPHRGDSRMVCTSRWFGVPGEPTGTRPAKISGNPSSGSRIGWAGDDGRDQTVDGADANIVSTAVPAKDQVHFLHR